MKKLHLVLVCTLVMLSAAAQKQYFVYLQAESDQPFFIKLNQKTVWSSPGGYLIVPKLVDSTYTFTVGFPQNKWPEQHFTVAVNKKDHGFLLKNFDDRGWGLFDLQSMDVQMATNTAVNSNNNTTGDNSVTPFAEILSKAADDPSLKEKTVRPKKEEVKTEVVTEPVKDTVSIVNAASNTAIPVSTETEQPKKSKKKKQKDTETVSTDKPVTEPVKTETKTEEKTVTSPEVTNTAMVEEKKPVVTEEKPVTPVTEEKKETKTETKEPVAEVKTEQKEPAVQEVKKEEVITRPSTTAEQEKYKASDVKKYAESSTTEGFGLVYIDQYGDGSKDTIRLMIPNPKPVVTPVKEQPKEEKKFLDINAEAKNNSAVQENTVTENKETITAPEEKPLTKKEKKAKKEEEDKPVQKETVKQEEPQTPKEAEVKSTADTKNVQTSSGSPSNNCVDLATEDEFVKLRKRMAGEKEDKMVAEAQKAFKTKCFSTNQVRTLGRLFETDEERYHFFDAAYKHVFNPEAFPALESEFQDSYYAGRFKAMLRN